MHLTREEFEELVVAALAEVPEEFREKLENIEIVVEDWPGPQDLGSLKLRPGTLLLGLYRGVPLTARSVGFPPLYPATSPSSKAPSNGSAGRGRKSCAKSARRCCTKSRITSGFRTRGLRELGY